MMDEVVGHMTEKVVIPARRRDRNRAAALHHPASGRISRFRARRRPCPRHAATSGEGYNVHVTGLTHDERGYPDMRPRCRSGWSGGWSTKITKTSSRSALRGRSDRRRRRGRGLLRHHLARGAARHRNGARRRAEGRQVPADHRVAVPGKADSRTSPQR